MQARYLGLSMSFSHSDASKWNSRISKLEHHIELENVDVSNWQLWNGVANSGTLEPSAAHGTPPVPRLDLSDSKVATRRLSDSTPKASPRTTAPSWYDKISKMEQEIRTELRVRLPSRPAAHSACDTDTGHPIHFEAVKLSDCPHVPGTAQSGTATVAHLRRDGLHSCSHSDPTLRRAASSRPPVRTLSTLTACYALCRSTRTRRLATSGRPPALTPRRMRRQLTTSAASH